MADILGALPPAEPEGEEKRKPAKISQEPTPPSEKKDQPPEKKSEPPAAKGVFFRSLMTSAMQGERHTEVERPVKKPPMARAFEDSLVNTVEEIPRAFVQEACDLLKRYAEQVGKPEAMDAKELVAFSNQLVDVAILECERFYPTFQYVIWGGQGAKDAIATAMIDTAGEA